MRIIKKTSIMLFIIAIFFGTIFFDVIYTQLELYISQKDGHTIELRKIDNFLSNIKFEDLILYTPIVYENSIFVQTQNNIFMIDNKTRKILWKIPFFSNSFNSPLVPSDIYSAIPDRSNEINLIDNRSGSILWSSKLNKSNANYEIFNILDIKIIDKFVVAARYCDKFYFLDISTGTVLFDFEAPNRVNLSIRSYNNLVLLIDSNEIRIIELKSKRIIKIINGNFSPSSAYINNNFLSIVNKQNEVISIDSFDLRTFEKISISESKSAKTGCILIIGNDMIFSSDGIEKFNINTGKIEWSNFKVNGLSCPILNTGSIFVRRESGDLFQINFRNGNYINRIILPNIRNNNYPDNYDPIIVNNNELLVLLDMKTIGFLAIQHLSTSQN